ncbi:CYTH domain-containing protein [Enterococcus sp. BWB1-3]|uniref:CYTH domain-containing protein n=1 Tax=unclassified Enterococcus TaxID=2608891 RepID=UPI0019245B54|nr:MULTISPECIES: CYTH domain-containing protein [unclassified Enterococcus]MBL1229780.1 CYTH domain-containing protein [Enterococcus sp. BWB1-3]MCB5953015.1 CYTH domain-containing protein [Enterococcus sp. BWT-B8]MCB5956278.1 CYTH domain-containing protein [Enterococcus sp. CWB-B31]
MSKDLEIEYKTLLSKENFFRTAEYFKFKETDFFIQMNTYFDTFDFQLKERAIGLRIRTLPDKAEVTLKIPNTVGLLEITDSLSFEQANKMIHAFKLPKESEVFQKLKELNIDSPLQVIGELKTKRAQKKLPQGLLALDESWYNDTHDFELELEVEDAVTGKIAFNELLDTLSIEKISGPNKIQRMMLSAPSHLR